MLTRREGQTDSDGNFTQTADGVGDRPNFLYVNAAGTELAELSEGGNTRASAPTMIQKIGQAMGVWASTASDTSTISWQLDETNPGGGYDAGGGMVVTVGGDTLQTVAQRVYGNASLWYVIADANNLDDPNAGLTEGVELKTPSLQVTSNDAATLKPYDPSQAIGSTTPSLPYITPPPQTHCNPIANLIRVVVAVICLLTPGLEEFSAAALATTAATTAVLGATGEFMAETVENIGGQRNGYDPGAIVAAGLTAGAGSGGGGLGVIAAAATAVVGDLAHYGVDKLLGEKASFSWKNIAVDAGAAALASAVLPSGSGPGQLTGSFSWQAAVQGALVGGGEGLVTEGIHYGLQKAITGSGQWSWTNVAMQAAEAGLAAGLTNPRPVTEASQAALTVAQSSESAANQDPWATQMDPKYYVADNQRPLSLAQRVDGPMLDAGSISSSGDDDSDGSETTGATDLTLPAFADDPTNHAQEQLDVLTKWNAFTGDAISYEKRTGVDFITDRASVEAARTAYQAAASSGDTAAGPLTGPLDSQKVEYATQKYNDALVANGWTWSHSTTTPTVDGGQPGSNGTVTGALPIDRTVLSLTSTIAIDDDPLMLAPVILPTQAIVGGSIGIGIPNHSVDIPIFGKIVLPKNNGSWTNPLRPGNSGWLSTNPNVIAVTKGMPVPFKNGVVNFDPWSQGKLYVLGMTGNSVSDLKLGRNVLRKKLDLPDEAAVKRWLKTQELTLHHNPDGMTLDLIPSDLHNNVNHTGGAANLRGWDPSQGTPKDFFIANRIAAGGRYLGIAGMAYGAYADGRSLLAQYQISQQTGDYSNLEAESLRVAGGWAGAWAVGSSFGEIGAGFGSAFGPVGLVVGGLVGGFIGGIAGYAGGSYAVPGLASDIGLLPSQEK